MTPMNIPGIYFDGQTSRRHQVQLSVVAGNAVLAGDISRSCPLEQLHVSERARHAARKVSFPDGAYLEVLDTAGFNALLAASGHRDSLVVRMQQSWRAVLIACVALLATLAVGYLYAVPLASEAIAKALPESTQRAIGRGTLDLLDQHLFLPSTLPAERRDAIVARFAGMAPPRPGQPAHEILFRKGVPKVYAGSPPPEGSDSMIGPNAFSLPSGQIILTDEIVRLVDDEDELMGILAHELGHLHERHMLRQLIQSSAIAAAALVLGDASTLVATIPSGLLSLRYSREAEREADDYAIAMLRANGLPPSNLVRALEKLGASAAELPPYLATHPPLSERVGRLRDVR